MTKGRRYIAWLRFSEKPTGIIARAFLPSDDKYDPPYHEFHVDPTSLPDEVLQELREKRAIELWGEPIEGTPYVAVWLYKLDS